MNKFIFLTLRIALICFSISLTEQAISQTIDTNSISTDSQLNLLASEKRGVLKSGYTYFVDSTYEFIIAYDPSDKLEWKINVIKNCGFKNIVGEPKIRHLKLYEKYIAITFGKHCFANIELNTGQISNCGCD